MKIRYSVTVILTNPFRQVHYTAVFARDEQEAIQRAKSMCTSRELVLEGKWSAQPYRDEDPVEL